jgi:hypothetical protein
MRTATVGCAVRLVHVASCFQIICDKNGCYWLPRRCEEANQLFPNPGPLFGATLLESNDENQVIQEGIIERDRMLAHCLYSMLTSAFALVKCTMTCRALFKNIADFIHDVCQSKTETQLECQGPG